jgi:hypothetical protein
VAAIGRSLFMFVTSLKVRQKDKTWAFAARKERVSEAAVRKVNNPPNTNDFPRERHEQSGCQSPDGRGRSRSDAPMQD